MEKKSLKCVIVGDTGSGKTSLLTTFAKGIFPSKCPEVAFFDCPTDIMVGERMISLNLHDSHGAEEYYRSLIELFPGTDVFLIGFSVASSTGFESIRATWFPRLLHYCPKTPVVIVGMKIDLREDPQTLDLLAQKKMQVVSAEQGNKVAKDLSRYVRVKYMECSSLKQQGVRQVFEDAVGTIFEEAEGKTKNEGASSCSCF
eukprot:TRINITY_DN3222_c0_g1_i1.p1 TRINITY_DN3222_c0_g1~~TRINITY_DN3222_c0_g1_i1.p1  ORF type:complete len:201 (-),score=25.20 TRINITY_DN3222_c0_g1_i1:38-640(-)